MVIYSVSGLTVHWKDIQKQTSSCLVCQKVKNNGLNRWSWQLIRNTRNKTPSCSKNQVEEFGSCIRRVSHITKEQLISFIVHRMIEEKRGVKRKCCSTTNRVFSYVVRSSS